MHLTVLIGSLVVPWHAPGVSWDAACGATYDGRIFNLTTGELQDAGWTFSAPSKESLHIALLAHAVAGNPLAQQIYNETAAVSILSNKLAAFLAFNRTFPGFGGYLPWFQVSNGSLQLLNGWTTRTPALDNGEV